MNAKELRRGCQVPGAGVIGSCELPSLGTVNLAGSSARTNSTCSYTLCHLTSPFHVFCGCYISQNKNLKSSVTMWEIRGMQK